MSRDAVSTRWSGPRVYSDDILEWLVGEGFVVAVGTDMFVVTDVGLGVSAALNDSAGLTNA